MFKRIVKLEFKEDKITDFLADFEKVKAEIRAFPGCNRLELLQDKYDTSVFFTFSIWETEQDLENYKNSELFGIVWPQTKALFRDKALAWSVDSMHELA